MKIIVFTSILLASFHIQAQLSKSQIDSLRTLHIEELKDSTSVLNAEEIASFGGLDYFNFDPSYQIQVRLKKQKGPKFEMPTSTDRKPIYRRYGYIEFNLHGQLNRLEVFQNVELSKNKEYKNYLFIPFRDQTSSNETYGGGRYLDIEKSKSKTYLIDFNLAYNPYCAYSYRYSCPIPPKQNTLTIPIEAGEKTPIGH